MNANELIARVAVWSERDPRVQGAAICGSYARGEQRVDSDLDICLLSGDPQSLLNDRAWIYELAPAPRIVGPSEDYKLVQSLRVLYASLEVEFAIAAQAWAEPPIDHETAAVINDGLEILVDTEGRLAAARALAATMSDRRRSR